MISRSGVSLAVLLPTLWLAGGRSVGAQVTPPMQAADTSYYVTLGGVEQYVEIRGASRDLPVLLYLHGGPCMPASPLLRYHQAELSRSFVVVSWDQRRFAPITMPIPLITMDRSQ